jgi:predicted phage-related endonuclease
MNINEIMKELAEYTRISEEINAQIEGLKDKLKEYMITNNLDTLTGDEHKATFKAVSSSRLDSKGLRAAYPAIAEQFTKTSTCKRFLFK